MGRFLFIIGLLLIFVSVGYMIFFISGNEMVGGLICNGDETLEQQHRQTFSGNTGGSTTDFYCVDEEGESRDVTDTMIIVGAGGFIAIFLPSLLMTIIGGRMMMKRTTKQFINKFVDGQNINDISQYQPQSQDDVQAILQQLSAKAGKPAPAQGTLTDRLKQLEDARDDGLLSQAEYDRMRQTILDNID